MARYRLMLLDAPPRHAAALDELERSLPAAVDAVAYRGMRERAFADPVLLGSGDDLATLEAATATLQKAGLAVCVVDDSTPWIRLVETARSTLGFTTVHVADARNAAPQPASSLPRSKPAEARGPTLRDPRNSIWLRGALVLGALLLPMAGALLASTFLGDALYDAPAPASSTTPESASGHGRGRRLPMRAGAGSAGGSSASERSPGGRGGAGGSAPSMGAANGDSIELTQDAPTGEADATPAARAHGARRAGPSPRSSPRCWASRRRPSRARRSSDRPDRRAPASVGGFGWRSRAWPGRERSWRLSRSGRHERASARRRRSRRRSHRPLDRPSRSRVRPRRRAPVIAARAVPSRASYAARTGPRPRRRESPAASPRCSPATVNAPRNPPMRASRPTSYSLRPQSQSDGRTTSGDITVTASPRPRRRRRRARRRRRWSPMHRHPSRPPRLRRR
ncbi:MAG: hypothetical protein IPN17_12390 [Deltaproteobacteria bacterium]|nr:hypothetical protein [Deltaproteobacteria bacterium]